MAAEALAGDGEHQQVALPKIGDLMSGLDYRQLGPESVADIS